MPLPHFTQLQTTQTFHEAVHPSLYEVVFVLPTLLQGRDDLALLENATVAMDLAELHKEIPVVGDQRFKYSTRVHLGLPADTHAEFTISFNVNQNENGSIFVWNTLRSWYDLAWNSQDGSAHYKSDMIGTIIVHQHDKKGFVIRRITYRNAMLHGLGGFDGGLDWSKNSDIVGPVEAKFAADYWVDEFIDDQFVDLGGQIAAPFNTAGDQPG